MRAPSGKAIRLGWLLLAVAGAAVLVLLVGSGRSFLVPAQEAQAVPGVADAETINLCADEGDDQPPRRGRPRPDLGLLLGHRWRVCGRRPCPDRSSASTRETP